MIPRIRGRTGKAEEGPHVGKWFYEISIWDFTGEQQAGEPFQFGPFNTEDEAHDFGRKATKDVAQFLEKRMTGETSERYLDMKNGGIMRPWEDQ